MYVFADPSQFITKTAELEPLGFPGLLPKVLDLGITVQEANVLRRRSETSRLEG